MNTRRHYDIDSILEEVVTLPSMPDTVARMMRILDAPDCSLAEVAEVAALDPSITVKILRLVNSAFYGLGCPVSTVHHAVSLLGVKVIRNLVLSATLFNSLQGHPLALVKHCIGVGLAMRLLAARVPLKGLVGSQDEAFVYGLIHDIGKTMFAAYLPEEYEEVGRRAGAEGIPWQEAEREVLGVDHAEMGAALAKHWKLNSTVVEVIASHHAVEQCSANRQCIAASLAAADFMTNASGLSAHPQPVLVLEASVWSHAGISSPMLPGIMEAFFGMTHEIDALLEGQ